MRQMDSNESGLLNTKKRFSDEPPSHYRTESSTIQGNC